jgi:hypothetical protein
MTKQLISCLVGIVLGCILEGCVTDHQAGSDNPNYLEDTSVTAHGAATVSYGHSVVTSDLKSLLFATPFALGS